MSHFHNARAQNPCRYGTLQQSRSLPPGCGRGQNGTLYGADDTNEGLHLDPLQKEGDEGVNGQLICIKCNLTVFREQKFY